MRFKILGILGFAILLLVFRSQVVFAQEAPEEVAKKYGVTFPIADLGECVDYSSCRTYCEDPVNQSTCIDFAKKKGFYKEDSIKTQSRFIDLAKRELGCDSEASCREFCSNEANWEKCGEFARRHNLTGGVTHDPKDAKILEVAKTELGCTSYESCMAFCHEEPNRQKCSDFAKKAGIRGGEHHVGPGGCNSEATCKVFCSDPNNFQECSRFGGGTGGGSGGGFHGPGGCNSEESCKAYCQSNPSECKIIMAGEHGGVADPRVAAEEYAKYCRDNPEGCVIGGQGPFGGRDARDEFEKFCSDNPEKCGTIRQPTSCPGGQYFGPGGVCTPLEKSQEAFKCSQVGKYWDGNSCHDLAPSHGGYPSQEGQNYSPTYAPPPPGGYSTDPATGCVQAGCTWNGTSCSCGGTSGTSGGSSFTPPPESTPSYITPSAYETPSNPTP